jgi:hypothetical protein
VFNDAPLIPTYIGYVKPNPKAHASRGTDLSTYDSDVSCANELLIKSKTAEMKELKPLFHIYSYNCDIVLIKLITLLNDSKILE